VDISGKARNGTYLTPVLDPGEIRTIKVIVTVGEQAPADSQVQRLVTTTSTSDPLRVDVVRIIVKRR
jgi:hypothetical protein